jgi:hypothetical protein
MVSQENQRGVERISQRYSEKKAGRGTIFRQIYSCMSEAASRYLQGRSSSPLIINKSLAKTIS